MTPLFFMSLLAVPQAAAKDQPSDDGALDAAQLAAITDNGSDDKSGEVVDEITVRGYRTLRTIERDIEFADDVMNNTFNELNHDNKFDIICQLERKPHSFIKHRVCKPNFERGIDSEMWEDNANTPDFRRVSADVRRNREILKQKMLALAADNPQLAAAIVKRAKLQQDYDREVLRQEEE